MSETPLQRRMRNALEREFGGFWGKTHGGPFPPAGIPDLVGVVDGYFIAIEVKVPGKEPSKIQIETIATIQEEGGICFVSDCVKHAIATVAEALRLSASRRETGARARRLLPILRAASRQDVRNPRRDRTARQRIRDEIRGHRSRSQG